MPRAPMPRRYAHYTEWEDWRAGMFAQSSSPAEDAIRAAKLLRDPAEFHTAAADMVTVWPVIAGQRLTDVDQNRRAWVGQAACCYALGVPEMCTRAGWWLLAIDEQTAANRVADDVITEWEKRNSDAQTLF